MSPNQAGAEREKLVFLGVLILCLASLAAHGGIRLAIAKKLSQKLAGEKQAALASRQQSLEEAEAHLQEALVEAETAAREGQAAKVRQEEFLRRQAMEEGFAKSAAETRLLEMARLSRDSSLDPASLLKKLAEMASPQSSGIRVSRQGKGYAVEMALPLSEIKVPAHGGRTDTRDLHREVRRLTAGIIRDLFLFGAGLGLNSVEVSCQKLTDPKGHKYTELYRASLTPRSAKNDDWLAASRADVLQRMRVHHDEFGRIVKRR